jgi:uncharacterized membrane protein YgcG
VDSLRWIGGRVADLGSGFVDTFLRDNKLLPPILALLALFVFAWVLAGAFIGGPDDQKPVAHRSELAQADGGGASDPPAPEVENRNVDSYAAYRSKDPFRQVLAVVRTTPEGTTPVPPEETTTGPGKTKGAGPGNGGNRQGQDSDFDGLPDSKEAALGLDRNNPDTDGDGTPDGLDDANGDGRPDGAKGGAAAGGGNNRSGGGGGGARGGRPGRGNNLLDSGGTLSPPP